MRNQTFRALFAAAVLFYLALEVDNFNRKQKIADEKQAQENAAIQAAKPLSPEEKKLECDRWMADLKTQKIETIGDSLRVTAGIASCAIGSMSH